MPIWLQILIAVLTPVIAFSSSYIAYKQWKIGSTNLKINLYEKRWAIYAAANDALVASLNEDDNAKHLTWKTLQSRALNAQFLFPSEIAGFFDELVQRMLDLRDAYKNLKMEPVDGIARSKITDEITVLDSYFRSLLKGDLRNKMKPFLDLNAEI